MILILDNTPYHHKRAVPVMTSLSNALMIFMISPIVAQVLDAPFLFPTSKPKKIAFYLTEEGKRLIVESGGEDYIAVSFNTDEFQKRENGICIHTSEKLKLMFLSWLKTNRSDLLVNQIKKLLVNNNHEIISTPPYIPETQPIETFWGEGKGYAAQ